MKPATRKAASNRLGENLRNIRKRAGLTQEDLGRLSGVPQDSISKYETGENEPTIRTLLKLATALQVDVDDLVEGVNPSYDDQKRARKAQIGLAALVLGQKASGGQSTEQESLAGAHENAGSAYKNHSKSPLAIPDNLSGRGTGDTSHVANQEPSGAGDATPRIGEKPTLNVIIDIIESLLEYARHLEGPNQMRDTLSLAARALLGDTDRSLGVSGSGEADADRGDRGQKSG